jgi:hypothetical protein
MPQDSVAFLAQRTTGLARHVGSAGAAGFPMHPTRRKRCSDDYSDALLEHYLARLMTCPVANSLQQCRAMRTPA